MPTSSKSKKQPRRWEGKTAKVKEMVEDRLCERAVCDKVVCDKVVCDKIMCDKIVRDKAECEQIV